MFVLKSRSELLRVLDTLIPIVFIKVSSDMSATALMSSLATYESSDFFPLTVTLTTSVPSSTS